MLRDIGSAVPRRLFVKMVTSCDEANELSEMATEILIDSDASVVDELLEHYDGASDYAQMLILEICAHFPEAPRVLDLLLDKLRTCPDNRAFYAALLGDLGNPEAIEPLKRYLEASDLTYLDFIELRNAVETLGGDAGEERTFYGDPDYEAMRNV